MTTDDPHGPAIFCFDGSEGAATAIKLARPILRDRHPAVVLFVHTPTERSLGGVGSGPDAPIVGAADAETVLERGVALARDAGFEPEPLRVEADRKTAAIIADVAAQRDADVIVMGQRGRSGLAAAVLGSVSRDVINAADRPVLVV
jgi:nucleotide-binding universal stress UspA family protein